MSDAYDELEVAKLATFVGSQLKTVDQLTSGAQMPANRINQQDFIQRVVSAANPNAAPQRHPNIRTNEEAKMLEMLNAQALGQIPDVSVGSKSPELIPMQQPQVSSQPQMVAPPATIYPQSSTIATDHIKDIAETLKSIDNSIKLLCDVFVQKNIKKKKKRKINQKPKSQVLEENVPNLTATETINHQEVNVQQNDSNP